MVSIEDSLKGYGFYGGFFGLSASLLVSSSSALHSPLHHAHFCQQQYCTPVCIVTTTVQDSKKG